MIDATKLPCVRPEVAQPAAATPVAAAPVEYVRAPDGPGPAAAIRQLVTQRAVQ